MRSFIRVYLIAISSINVIILICLLLTGEYAFTDALIIWIIVHGVLSLIVLYCFNRSNLTSDWFKSHKELYKERIKAERSWKRAEELIRFLKQTETRKLWENIEKGEEYLLIHKSNKPFPKRN
jgi:O-antigen/teichoic acid export membrane protein